MKDVKISEMLVRDCEDGRREYYHLLIYFDGGKNITIESTGAKNYKLAWMFAESEANEIQKKLDTKAKSKRKEHDISDLCQEYYNWLCKNGKNTHDKALAERIRTLYKINQRGIRYTSPRILSVPISKMTLNTVKEWMENLYAYYGKKEMSAQYFNQLRLAITHLLEWASKKYIDEDDYLKYKIYMSRNYTLYVEKAH